MMGCEIVAKENFNPFGAFNNTAHYNSNQGKFMFPIDNTFEELFWEILDLPL